MSTITTSANAIVEVNKALHAVLQQYIDPQSSGIIDIRFDLPNVSSTQSSPTVSVFLYDVHEDLQLRQSEPARINPSSSILRAGWVNLSCNYLITYWEAQQAAGDGNGPDSSPDNQAVQIITRTLQALLNNRELSGLPGAYTRVIPPQENLNSLGNFWQALGNRPRLSLIYSITVPILLDNSLPQALVKTIGTEIVQSTTIDIKVLNQQLWQVLCEQYGDHGKPLARVTLESQPLFVEEGNAFAINIHLQLSGIVDKTYKNKLETLLAEWSNNKESVTELNGVRVYISKTDTSGLKYI